MINSKENVLVEMLKLEYPSATIKVTKFENVTIENIPFDGNTTIKYCFYFHDDGIRIRRKIHLWITSPRYYQLNRNSHTNKWPAFKSCNDAVEWFKNYINKNSINH